MQNPQQQAIAALCAQRGLVPNPVNPGGILGGIFHGMFESSFASPDGTTWICDVWTTVGSGRQMERIRYSQLTLTIPGLNLPYVGVVRKGDISVPLVEQGQELTPESIDFDDRFRVRANDRNAAVMLLDQGMTQWLLDCDEVSFAMEGNHVQAVVNRQSGSTNRQSNQPFEFELLFKFGDGFVPRIPATLRTEYAATGGPTVPGMPATGC
jgi:hypothetical protein